MSNNTFGQFFSFTTWGESHGKAIGCIVDGCPPQISLTEEDFTRDMNRRKPGQSKYTTQRKEDDTVEILSGTFENQTTGSPISLIIWNKNQKSKDYSEIAEKFRPGHADYTYWKKYGIRDYKGGGRSSARETACRVAAGVVAKKILPLNMQIMGYVSQIGDAQIKPDNINYEEINKNPFFSPDKEIVPKWEDIIETSRKDGNSVGAKLTIIAKNVPPGLGDPIYRKLNSELARAFMSINAVKAVEIGTGSQSASQDGVSSADEMYYDDSRTLHFSNNNNGGILGGISSGQDIVVTFTVKATSSTLKTKKTIDIHGNNTEISTKGRHDPCVGIRAVAIGEAMLACVLADRHLASMAYNQKRN